MPRQTEIVRELIATQIVNLVPSSIAMVGDRRQDIMAGKSNGTRTLAVDPAG